MDYYKVRVTYNNPVYGHSRVQCYAVSKDSLFAFLDSIKDTYEDSCECTILERFSQPLDRTWFLLL